MSIHTQHVEARVINWLWLVVYPSAGTWSRLWSKSPPKGQLLSLVPFRKDVAWHFLICARRANFQLSPPVTSNIITWAQNMFKGQSENRHCNEKWSFKEENQWENRSLGGVQQQFMCSELVLHLPGSKCLCAVMLATPLTYEDIGAEKIKIFLHGCRSLSDRIA